MKLRNSFACLSFVLLSVVTVFPQNKERIVSWSETQSNYAKATGTTGTELLAQIDALEIVDVAVSGKSIALGEPFTADDEWLKNLTVRVKNVSNLTIARVQMNFFLPEIMPGGPMVHLCFGCGGAGTEATISPGQEVELKLVFYDWVLQQINKKSSLPMITKAELWDFIVTLEGGKKLSSSCMKTKSPKSACPSRP